MSRAYKRLLQLIYSESALPDRTVEYKIKYRDTVDSILSYMAQSNGETGSVKHTFNSSVTPKSSDPSQESTEETYYNSYILPLVNRFSYQQKSESKDDESPSEQSVNVLSDPCKYEEFDRVMKESRAAALISQVLEEESRYKQEDKTTQNTSKTTTQKSVFTSKRAVDERTRGLSMAFKVAKSRSSKLLRLEEICFHLRQFPDTKSVPLKLNLVNIILQTRQTSKDKTLQSVCNEALAHLGYVPPLKRKGISLLSIDGGGSRGVISVEILREIEKRTGHPIPDLFDYVAGTSTGALLAILLCVYRLSMDECEQLYKNVSQQVFAKSLWGTGRLMWNHAYYDSSVLSKIYRNNMGEKLLIESARDKLCPKLIIVSTSMNQTRLTPYLFRNYALPQRVQSHYQGTSQYKLWECLVASCSAPGYFQDCQIGNHILQDGGILTNNPTAVGLHEAMLMWPGQSVQCVVSVGNGRYEDTEMQETVSLKNKLAKIVDSVTDTEKVHTVLHDLLPPSSYFRLNPYMSENITLDEQSTDKLEQLQTDAHMYIRRNENKFKLLTQKLLEPKSKHIELIENVQKLSYKWL